MVSSLVLPLVVLSAALISAQSDFAETSQLEEVRHLSMVVRDTVQNAKQGIMLNTLRKEIEDLASVAFGLKEKMPDQDIQCEADMVIKMAAQRTGSHEVLSVLLADDPFAMLSGRLGLALAMLDDVASQMEDVTSRDVRVAGHLSALTFLAETAANVIRNADEAAKVKKYAAQATRTGSETGNGASRVRRQSIDLGGGFGLSGSQGLSWTNKGGSFTIHAGPQIKLSPIRIDGWQAGVVIRF